LQQISYSLELLLFLFFFVPMEHVLFAHFKFHFSSGGTSKYFKNAILNVSTTSVTAGQTASFSVTLRDSFGRGPLYDADGPDIFHTNVVPSSDCQSSKHLIPSSFAVSDMVTSSFLFGQACLHRAQTFHIRQNSLLATYYSSTSLTSPVATRLVPSIDFSGASLGSQPVASLASGAGWSVRWAGFVRAPVAGGATWTFFIGLAAGGNGGNGVRGWVDGVAVVNGWSGVAGGGEVSGTVVLSGASNSYYEVVVEYKAVGGAYGCTLSWQSASFAKTIVVSSRFWYPVILLGLFNISVVPGVVDGSVSSFYGSGLSIATVGFASSFCVNLKDSFGNAVDFKSSSAFVTAGEMSGEGYCASWTQCSLSSCCTFNVFKISGNRILHLSINGNLAQISPINVIVHHGISFEVF
jgi:hypothetical protein